MILTISWLPSWAIPRWLSLIFPKRAPHVKIWIKPLRPPIDARDLVKQILAFSRQTEHALKPVRLHVIIEEALQLIRASLPTTIEIYQDLSQESDIVLADPIQIHQVVINLCSNAHQAMQEKGGSLYASP